MSLPLAAYYRLAVCIPSSCKSYCFLARNFWLDKIRNITARRGANDVFKWIVFFRIKGLFEI